MVFYPATSGNFINYDDNVYVTENFHVQGGLALDQMGWAFQSFAGGSWNLYLRDLRTGAIHRLTDAPCNQIQPSWEADSKTLLYATDCGRALWFTAIARRQFLP